jgi:hypothetical protein
MATDTALTFAGLAASWLAAISGTWKLFENVDKAASTDAKENVASMLKADAARISFERFSEVFAMSFDLIFGPQLLSLRAFRRSCIASLFFVVLTFFIWVFLRPTQALALFASDERISVAAVTVGLTGLLSLLPDYLSLAKTRYFVSLMKRSRSYLRSLALLLLDAAISGLIGLLAFGLYIFFAMIVVERASFSSFINEVYRVVTENVIPLNANRDGAPPGGMWFYASFFTSVWLWLYCLSGVVLRSGHALAFGQKLIAKFTDIEGKPFLALGVAATLLETLFFAVVALFLAFAHAA